MAEQFAFNQLYRHTSQDHPATLEVVQNTSRILDREVAQLERRLSEMTGAEHCVMVCSAQQGLYAALAAAGIGAGDRVLCSGFAPEFVTRCILLTGAVPMPVDINPNSFNLDPFCLEYVIGKCMRTGRPIPTALVATDMFGLPCSYPKLEAICEKHGILLIADVTQSLGATLENRSPASYGRFAVTSFAADPLHPEQSEGGAVLCHSQDDADRLRDICGSSRSPYAVHRSACSDAVLADLAAMRLQQLPSLVSNRRETAARYDACFQGKLRIQQSTGDIHSACTRYALVLPEPGRREGLLEQLKEQGVPCTSYRPTAYADQPEEEWDRVMLVNTVKAAKSLICIPMHSHISNRVAGYIAQCIVSAVLTETADL